MNELLKIADVAKTLNVSIDKVRSLVASGELRAIRISTRGDLRFRPSDVKGYIAERETLSA